MVVAGNDLSPAMRAIATHLQNITTKAFQSEAAPDGTPWGDIPARPFLGLPPTDRPRLENILGTFIQRQWRE